MKYAFILARAVAFPVAVARNFTANERDETWVGDVTAIWTAQGWLFLAVLLDLFSRRVVGWATSAHNDRFLALAALRDAIAKGRPEEGLVHHSDHRLNLVHTRARTTATSSLSAGRGQGQLADRGRSAPSPHARKCAAFLRFADAPIDPVRRRGPRSEVVRCALVEGQ